MAEAAEDITEDLETETPTWPEDWRQQLAGDDEKALKQLERYEDPAAVWNKARALEQRISSGELKDTKPFPKDGTDEEKNAWRKAQGIPLKAEEYELSRKIEEDAEKEAVMSFLNFAHENNFDPKLANTMVDYFYGRAEEDAKVIQVADQKDKDAMEDKLRAEWGDDYRLNQNKIESMLDLVPEGAKEVMDARLPDGTKLANSPAFQQFMLLAANAHNPTQVITRGEGDVFSSIQDEIDEIKSKMGTKEYDRKMRARYNELLTELDRLGKLPDVPK